MSELRYRIYPSLLDKFQSLLDYDVMAEESWNKDADGGYKLTPDEMADRQEKELLDYVNRVPHPPIEAADKGTCFNEIVDCLLAHTPCTREDISITRIPNMYDVCDNFCRKANCDYKWNACNSSCIQAYKAAVNNKAKAIGLLATLNGFEFRFDIELCRDTAAYFKGAVSQHFCRAVLPTRYGDVELYGYADYIVADRVYDLKTTSQYTFGKFERSWQKHVYPYCLVASGEMPSVSSFEYTVLVLGKGKVITGKMYNEVYTYRPEASLELLRNHTEHFIEWLEDNRDRITDKKIFNME